MCVCVGCACVGVCARACMCACACVRARSAIQPAVTNKCARATVHSCCSPGLAGRHTPPSPTPHPPHDPHPPAPERKTRTWRAAISSCCTRHSTITIRHSAPPHPTPPNPTPGQRTARPPARPHLARHHLVLQLERGHGVTQLAALATQAGVGPGRGWGVCGSVCVCVSRGRGGGEARGQDRAPLHPQNLLHSLPTSLPSTLPPTPTHAHVLPCLLAAERSSSLRALLACSTPTVSHPTPPTISIPIGRTTHQPTDPPTDPPTDAHPPPRYLLAAMRSSSARLACSSSIPCSPLTPSSSAASLPMRALRPRVSSSERAPPARATLRSICCSWNSTLYSSSCCRTTCAAGGGTGVHARVGGIGR